MEEDGFTAEQLEMIRDYHEHKKKVRDLVWTSITVLGIVTVTYLFHLI